MKQPFLKLAGVATLAAGMAFTQTAPAPSQPGAGNHSRRQGAGPGMHRFGADLNLTDAQKEQAKAIFAATKESSQAVHSQLRQSREALMAAVKSGASEAQIDQLSNSMAPLMAQSTAIRTKAFAKFYALLTPEQKEKVNARSAHFLEGSSPMRGRWQGKQKQSQQ